MQGVMIIFYIGILGTCIILVIGLLRLAWLNSHDRDGWKTRKHVDKGKRFWEED